jgi:hypothetical protein
MWRKKDPGKNAAQVMKRYCDKLQATPPWADLGAIKCIYREAQRLSKETGKKYHVDHFYPLKSEYMCGLHIPLNLRIIPALVNVRKNNKIISCYSMM